jgi:hypothetical protein
MRKFQSEDSFPLKTKTKSWNLMDVSEYKLNIRFDDSIETLLLKYLIDSYNRINGIRLQNLNKLNQELLERILTECRLQITRNMIQVLLGTFSDPASFSLNRTESKLTPFLFTQYISNDLVFQLILESSSKRSIVANNSNEPESSFTTIFTPVLNHLAYSMKSNSLSYNNSEFLQPLSLLKDLCSIKVEQVSPICNLVRFSEN